MNVRSAVLAVLLIGSALTVAGPADALVLTPDLTNEAPGTVPTAVADFPWLSVTITDTVANTVHVKIQANLAPDHFISDVNWNTNVGTAFTFGNVAKTGSFTVASGPTFAANAIKAGGGATNGTNTGFDFEVQFATKNAERFDLTEALDFDITCTASCTGFGATSFDAFNPDAGNAFYQLNGSQISANQPCPGGPGLCYRIAAHVQGLTGTPSSVWIAGVRPSTSVTEPAGLLVVAGALMALSGFARTKLRV